jgi:hypothetical protein
LGHLERTRTVPGISLKTPVDVVDSLSGAAVQFDDEFRFEYSNFGELSIGPERTRSRGSVQVQTGLDRGREQKHSYMRYPQQDAST